MQRIVHILHFAFIYNLPKAVKTTAFQPYSPNKTLQNIQENETARILQPFATIYW